MAAGRNSGQPGPAASPESLAGHSRGPAVPAGRCRRTDMPNDKKRWPAGQCPVCLGWGPLTQYTCCAACSKWRRAFPGQAACLRCSRVTHVDRDGLCRPCLMIVRDEDPGWILRPQPGRPLQLGFLLPGVRLPRASSLTLPANRKDKQAPSGITTAGRAMQPPRPRPEQPVAAHPVDPAQGALFDARRDWSFLNAGELDRLPALTLAASALVDELDRHARACGMDNGPRNNATKTLRILLAWLGADAPVHEADVRALSSRPSTAIRRVLQFLDDRGMIIPDPDRQGTSVERTIKQHIDALPDVIAGEVRQWVKVVRGQGRRAHRELPFSSVRSYLNCFHPVLAEWGQHVTSLREITRDDVQAALDEHPGARAHNLLPALRSLFRALKQEKVIFRDPARRITSPRFPGSSAWSCSTHCSAGPTTGRSRLTRWSCGPSCGIWPRAAPAPSWTAASRNGGPIRRRPRASWPSRCWPTPTARSPRWPRERAGTPSTRATPGSCGGWELATIPRSSTSPASPSRG